MVHAIPSPNIKAEKYQDKTYDYIFLMTVCGDIKYVYKYTLVYSHTNTMAGRVIEITNKNHKYFGERAVIQWKRPKMYMIRLLNKTVPLYARFSCFSPKLCGVRSNQITMYIKRSSFTFVAGETAATKINTWQTDTLRVLDKYAGLTKSQIEKKIGRKIDPCEFNSRYCVKK